MGGTAVSSETAMAHVTAPTTSRGPSRRLPGPAAASATPPRPRARRSWRAKDRNASACAVMPPERLVVDDDEFEPDRSARCTQYAGSSRFSCGRREPVDLRRASGRARRARRRSPPAPRLPPRPCGCRSPRRSWLYPRPLRDRHGRPPALHRADRRGARHGDAVSSPPSLAWRSSRIASISSVTALATSRPPGGSASIAASSTPSSLPPPPMKIACGARQAGECRGRRAFDDGQPWHAEHGRIAPDARGALGIALDGDGAQRWIGEHPLDRDRAGAGADVPQQFAAARRQRRQGERADLALGDLAVMLEQLVG